MLLFPIGFENIIILKRALTVMYVKIRLLEMYLEHPIKKHGVFWVPGPVDPLVLTVMPSWLIPGSEDLTLTDALE